MKVASLFGLLLLGACSVGGHDDLPAIRGMRSAAAEWALVNREAARGHLTPAYTAGMRDAARKQIAELARSLAKGSPAAAAATALQALPGDATPERLAVPVAALERIEAAREPA